MMNDSSLLQDARHYWAMLHKRRGIVVTCLTVCLLTAVVYNYTTRPVYQATAQILIATAQPNVLPGEEVVSSQLQDFNTEYQLIKGRALAEKVVARLKLQTSAELQTGPLMSPAERFQRKFLGRGAPTAVGSDGIPLSPAAAAVRSRLTVEPQSGGRLVNLRFSAYEPQLAADLANTLAQLYVEQALEFRFTNSTEATGWLGDRMGELRTKVESAERALLEYEARQGIQRGDKTSADKLSVLSDAVLQARMARIAKESVLNQARSLSPNQLSALPAIASNTVVQGVRLRVSELQAEQSRLSESLGEKHPDMVKLRNDLRNAEQKLHFEVQNALRALEAEVQAARAQEGTLEANLESVRRQGLDTDRKGIEYDALKRELETNRDLYQRMMNRSKEADIESDLKSAPVRVIEKAEVPRGPAYPQRTRNYQIAVFLGLVLGIGLGLLFEQVDNTIKTPEDIKDDLQIPFLGMVPDVSPPGSDKSPRPLIRASDGAVAEAYRVLRTNLIFSSAESTGRVAVVSSANPGEGKTTTAANLGTALALNGAKVLLVDADLRRPTLHQHFAMSKTPGLSDLIVGKCQASEAIHTTRYKGVQVLPCGYTAPNPAELLGSANMREILKALRSCYDWVLIDTPPILVMADTPVLCPYTDGVILVVAAEMSGRPAVQRSIDQIVGVGGKVIGAVLNKVDLKRNSYYYSHYYGEYYRNYYAPQPPPAPRARTGSSTSSRSS